MRNFDVIIIGGGAIGSSVAYFLKANKNFSGSVAVIEKDLAYGKASTPRSLGGIRQQFSISENIEIGLFGYEFVQNVMSYLDVDGTEIDLGWFGRGYLYLGNENSQEILKQNNRLQKQMGAKIDLLGPDDIRSKFPWINTDGVVVGSFGVEGEGWIDPTSLLNAFKRKAQSLGVHYIPGEVVAINKDKQHVHSVQLGDSSALGCGCVVNAAGAWAGRVAEMAGVILPVAPRKRMIHVIKCREKLDPPVPLIIDTTGVFVRSERDLFLCGVSPSESQDPDAWDDLELEYHWFDEVVWPSIANRIPAFESVKVTSAWSGWYDYNFFDHNGIIGKHPEIENLFLANGFSGHGLQQSPAVGRAIMELVTAGSYQTIDLSRFGLERILKWEPLLERNII